MSATLTRRALRGAALGCWLPGFAAAQGKSTVGKLQRWTRGATPPLALRDGKRVEHRLADYRGRVLLVNFWATWCEPCRDEMPSIARLAERFAGRPFAALLVNAGEGEAAANKFFSSISLDASRLAILYDRDMAVTRRWGATLLPASFLLGPDGRTRFFLRGEADWAAPEMVSTVEGLLPR